MSAPLCMKNGRVLPVTFLLSQKHENITIARDLEFRKFWPSQQIPHTPQIMDKLTPHTQCTNECGKAHQFIFYGSKLIFNYKLITYTHSVQCKKPQAPDPADIMSTRVSVSVRVEREDNGICQSTSYFPHLVIKPQTSSSHDLCVRGINTRTLKNTSWVPEDSSGMGKTGKICALLPAQ